MIEFKVGDKIMLKGGNPDMILEITAIYEKQEVVMLKGVNERWSGAATLENIVKVDEKKLKRKKVITTSTDNVEEIDAEKPKSKRGKQKSIEDFWP